MMQLLHTTLTIDEELAQRIPREVSLGKGTLKAVINDALRRGHGVEALKRVAPYQVKPHSSPFRPEVAAGKLNQLVDQLESEEFLARHHQDP
jgi:hypothetical protein